MIRSCRFFSINNSSGFHSVPLQNYSGEGQMYNKAHLNLRYGTPPLPSRRAPGIDLNVPESQHGRLPK